MHGHSDRFSTTEAVLAGAFFGGGLALLVAPQTGAQFRYQLRTYADKAKDDMAKTWGAAMDRGIKYAERSQRALRDAERVMDSAIDRGKEYLESGKSLVKTVRNHKEVGHNDHFLMAGAVLTGALIGGSLALFLAPQTGVQFRRRLRTYADKARDDMAKTWDTAMERVRIQGVR